MQVPVTSHQKHKSDLLNNPDSRSLLWFPEKARNAKGKGKYPSNSLKRAADNKQQGLAAERLQIGSESGSALLGKSTGAPISAAQDLVKMSHSSGGGVGGNASMVRLNLNHNIVLLSLLMVRKRTFVPLFCVAATARVCDAAALLAPIRASDSLLRHAL
jgi:hypothetical protein